MAFLNPLPPFWWSSLYNLYTEAILGISIFNTELIWSCHHVYYSELMFVGSLQQIVTVDLLQLYCLSITDYVLTLVTSCSVFVDLYLNVVFQQNTSLEAIVQVSNVVQLIRILQPY